MKAVKIKITEFPDAMITKRGHRRERDKTTTSQDGTPRYIVNPNSSATYSLQDCLEDGCSAVYDNLLKFIK